MAHFQNLIPLPRFLDELPGDLAFAGRLSIQTDGLSPEQVDLFNRLAEIVFGDWIAPGGVRLEVQLCDDHAPSELIGIADALREESYELLVSDAITLIAGHFRGLQRGIQTVRQLLEDVGDNPQGEVPRCRIVDWPRLAYRGMHYDFARETEYRPEHIKSIVARMAYFKLNTFHLYLEATFAFASAPHIVHPRPMTPDEARDLKAYAALFGIALVPQISTLGHMDRILHGPYEKLRENPAAAQNMCPTHPEARPFIAGMIRDIAEAFEPEFIHLGYDESHSGICERCQKHGTPQEILPEFLNWINELVKSHGARSMIYADKFLSQQQFPAADAANGGTAAQAQQALDAVNRDIVLTDWHYMAPYGRTVQALVKQGFEVHIVTDTGNYWHDSIPITRGAHWVADTIETATQEGAVGGFNCTWELYHGTWFENYWYFHGLAAERHWTDAPLDYTTFGRRFSRRFWGVEKDYYSDMAALMETTMVNRRGQFLKSGVFATSGLENARWDYLQIADYLDRQLSLFREAAKRNTETLQILDMPALIIRYLGTRVLGQILARNALDAGSLEMSHQAIDGMRAVALQVAAKLDEGYRLYGNAVEDRARIAAHIAELDAMLAGDLRESVAVSGWSATPLQPAGPVADAVVPDGPEWSPAPESAQMQGPDVRTLHGGAEGILFLRAVVRLPHDFQGRLLFGSDGPVKLWINGDMVACVPDATNPCKPDEYEAGVAWKAGENEILFALGTNGGKAWGLCARTAASADQTEPRA